MTARAATEPTLGFLLADVLRLLRRDFHARAAGLGLTPALARLLFHVHRQPGARPSDLAQRLDVTPVTLGRMLDRLARRGYVRRSADRADRRALRIHLAPRATPVVARMLEISALTNARATRGLRPAERAQLMALLGRLQANLGRESPP
ncbi:MAG: MarR family transcriptional regulator [Steroidobacteraceae bacterium]